MSELRTLILGDMKPALGVTEPAAIALAAAKARSLTEEEVLQVTVRMNSGIYKNGFTCGIPGTDDVGNAYSAALGVLCGDETKGLLVLENVKEADVEASRAMVAQGKVDVIMDSVTSNILIEATVKTEHDTCVATLKGSHTNFVFLKKNDEILLDVADASSDEAEEVLSPIVDYKVEELFDFALNAPLEDLQFMRDAYKVNTDLANAGMNWERCIITHDMIRQNGGKLLSDDARMSAKTLACAAAEARVLGIDMPAMSITGSGTHGIICTLPIEAYCRVTGIEEEKQLRATAISYLVTMYIKEFSGKLSAFCGCGIAGGTGLACALAYLMGGKLDAVEAACKNMSASITGMICTGGNHCCCMKVLSAVDSAFSAAELAAAGAAVDAPHG
ncbi:MAG: serine dehydratase subunit alpha family protein, partial [Clostridia bacterium]|nr:serine dehydratase subunit alpha family protein [Clostridia bacterium]